MTERGKVAVTPRSMSADGHPSLKLLTDAGYEVVFPSPGRQPNLEEQLEVVPDCVGYLAGVEPIEASLLDACNNLRVISRNGVGVDAIDTDAAEDRGVTVTAATGANSSGVAELTLGLMYALARHVAWSSDVVKRGEWQRRRGIEMAGRHLGVIGLGEIGQRVAGLGRAVGMRVVGHDPFVETEPEEIDELASFEELLSKADVVTLHRPPDDGPLIDQAALEITKPGLLLINTARAGLIDLDAVFEALDTGHLAGFATDVFPNEPPEVTALFAHDRVITTPHIGGYTDESVENAAKIAVKNLLDVLEG